MEFITTNLNTKIDSLISTSTEIIILTAFLKTTSLSIFENITHTNVIIITGLDFFITDPNAVEILERKYFDICVFYNQKSVFHPKCFYIKSSSGEHLVIGSSNMTSGGLEKNYEASILVKKDYNSDQLFKNFFEYYTNIRNSKHCVKSNSEVFQIYKTKYSHSVNRMTKEFNEQLNESVYANSNPIDNITDLKLNDWIYHDTYGIGVIIGISGQTFKSLFLKSEIKSFIITNSIVKLNNLKNDNINGIFSIEEDNRLNSLAKEFVESHESEHWINTRNTFYIRWRQKLTGEMSSDDIHAFFEESASIWTLFGLKKNILSERSNEFNSYLGILNDHKLSFHNRIELVCNKTNDGEKFDGVGRAISSSILNILNPNECPVFNNASDDVLKYFKITEKKFKGEKIADKYIRFTLLSLILMNKLGFNNLVEVDCFIGYIKTRYLR